MRIQNDFLATVLTFAVLVGAPLTTHAEELFSPPTPGSSVGSTHVTPDTIQGSSDQPSGVIVTDRTTAKVHLPLSAKPTNQTATKPKQIEPKKNANPVCSSGIKIEGQCLDFGDEYLPLPPDTTQRPTDPVGC